MRKLRIMEHISLDGIIQHSADDDDQAGAFPYKEWTVPYRTPAGRDALIHSIGNLTIVSQGLNSAVSNSDWTTKKPEILKSSLLPINQQLVDKNEWNEASIVDRSADLFKLALGIWPSPGPSMAGS